MMKNYVESVEINHNPNWPYIPDHHYRISIIVGAGPVKTNVILSLIKHQRPDTDKIYLYLRDPFESKYQLLINGEEKVGPEGLKIQKHSLIIHKQVMMLMKIWKIIIRERKGES